MAKFTFYRDEEVTTWIRDYYEVEAESQEEAEEIVRDADDIEDVAGWTKRDVDKIFDSMSTRGNSEIYNEYGEEIL